ncbi:hypothetical protein Pedsa_3255 [Pseudopedobacter saltans DSM 12145]|uniref:Glycosyltransferase subfamily 4-like N-terminal domain-containing protein n=1 Tax=Pseudopedobacter saltans (strain ATCC 51119 / DSM 12145 / JCM 21818 / CCUG 39354 / LMG 10337 / NBRC 100064 / NCIMB 13643) TaxID=762903 RepID=F0SBU9_PSESL|nr:hypothetical protein [Pseudopedobacter saltans]ADY53790.1 hypothetical protein Pedsa_3255 [Pseudopedobacter saltans DSM 12145]
MDVIILAYDLFKNTTSTNRYKVLVEVLSRKSSINVQVIDFHFENSKFSTISCDIENVDTFILKEKVRIVYPRAKNIQKFVLHSKSNYLKYIYQLLFKEEVITPRDNNLFIDLIKKSGNKGYIIVSGAPYGIFKYASKMTKKLGFELILDYRDPWTFGYQNLNGFKLAYKLKRTMLQGMERKLLKQASLITTVSETLKSYFPSEFQHKIHVIPNGSNYVAADIKPKEDKTFNIVYIGTIYNDQLQDNTFFLALKKFLYQKDQESIKLQFLGSFYTTALKEKIEEFDLSHITTITKRLKKDELLPYLNNTNIFLHLKYGDRSGIITSKQADYLFFRKPILLPVSDKGDLAESISKHKAGYICKDQVDIVRTLNMLYSKFLNGEVVEIVQSEEMLKHNSREAIAERFVGLILENK